MEIAARHPDVEARMVGFGPLEGAVRSRLGSAPIVILDGSLPGAIRRALAETDLLVTPSRTSPDGDAESLGLVNIEAQASGVPIVSTLHGGIGEAVHPDAGLLVKEGDISGLVGAIESLLANPDRWAAMGAAGRRHVAARFDLNVQVARVEERYLDLVGR
jgi:colanic acid/amylovoran biosynthesis glycosyltransferase